MPQAKIGVLQQAPRRPWVLWLGLMWLALVLIGLADVSARLMRMAGATTAEVFGPVAAQHTTAPRPQILEIRIASLASAASVAAARADSGALVVREAPLGSIDTLQVGDYITATNAAGKTAVFKVEALGADAANRAGQGALVLWAGPTAVVATPAYR